MAISGTDSLEVPIPYISGLFFRPIFFNMQNIPTIWPEIWYPMVPIPHVHTMRSTAQLDTANLRLGAQQALSEAQLEMQA